MNCPVAMTADGLERWRFSVTDIDRMTAAGILNIGDRYELLDGDIVPMSPQHTPHGRLTHRIARWLDNHVDEARFEVFLGVTVELSPHTRVDPDIYLARAGVTTDIVAADQVLWVIEVADASRWRDLKVKAPLYGKAGIAELWVVDVEGRSTIVHRSPTPNGRSEILAPAPFESVLSPSLFPDLELTIASL